VIRPERREDHRAVFQVNQQAFARTNEALLVEALRRCPAFIPQLSLVALEGPRVVGHILFTAIAVKSSTDSHPALALAPMSVLPALQRKGIGSSLVRRGLDDARRLGHGVVIVVGHPGYYPRFGFVPAEPLGIRTPFAVSSEALMALELRGGALRGVRGEVQYPPEFSHVEGAPR
jgi:putative acetyltransferase